MVLGLLVFGFLALVIIGTALATLFSRNTVYSALFLVLNFSTVALLYLTLGAPFIALVQISVYAGAIMVLFLFVIMMLGTEKLSEKAPFRGERWLAVIIGIIFMVEIALVFLWRGGSTALMTLMSSDFASPQAIGRLLFSEYALPFLVTGVLLLAAVIGAIALPRGEKPLFKDAIDQHKE